MGQVSDHLRRLGAALERAEYTIDGVRELLGPVAGGALARDEIVPALRATGGGSPLEALVRLFWLQVPVPADTFLDDFVAAGLAESSGGEVRARLRVEPVEGAGYAVSDLKVRPGSGGTVRPDHVVGAGGASANLARLAVHSPVDNALDIGTGCGVQALHLAGRAGRITATDVNPRALELAAMSAGLSGVANVEFVEGPLLEPVAGRRFDLIVSNPPFVVAPPGRRYVYRESGMPGDEFCRRLVTGAPALLNEGGHCRFLANWLQVRGVPWEERVGGWVERSGCDAWVVQRDVQDPAEYAELWLRDSCEAGTAEYRERYGAWLDHFERHGVTGIGFGWIALRKPAGGPPATRVEELRHAVEEPVGAYVEEILDGLVGAREFSTGCGKLVRAAAGIVQEQIGPPGAEDPERIVLRQEHRLRRAAGVGTVEAALAGVCDGTLPLEPLLAAIAQLIGQDAGQVRAHADAVLPELIADGFFVLG
ncbi:class I SAM-dependent methyltransferase [Spirillospora sp. NPDC029432]|uniref:class I SAM-dependent methyltransferase n=1 Tax=Spirillospora sp. NPDC029432 TaxID=3154599 RepID=UPI0034547B80